MYKLIDTMFNYVLSEHIFGYKLLLRGIEANESTVLFDSRVEDLKGIRIFNLSTINDNNLLLRV